MVAPVKNVLEDVKDVGGIVRRKETLADAMNSIIARHKASIRSLFQGGILKR